MIAWTAYAALVALVLGLAALLAEPLARARARCRHAWAAALVLTLLLGVALPLLGGLLAPLGSNDPPAAVRPAPPLPTALSRASRAASESKSRPNPAVERALAGAWLALSLAALAGVAVSGLRLQRRHSRVRRVGRATVHLGSAAGPAASGVLRPVLHLPAWYGELRGELRRLLYAHEAEHVRAADPRLVALALAGLVLMPWNPGMWWQARRLRLAIELDCDARVLRRKQNRRAYAALLLDVAGRRRAPALVVAGAGWKRTQIERRVLAMTAPRTASTLRQTAFRGAAGALLVLVACVTDRPLAPDAATFAREGVAEAAEPEARLGSVGGVARDPATGEVAAGALATIEGTELRTVANVQGRNLLLNVPAGPRTLVVSRGGHVLERQVVHVEAGRGRPIDGRAQVATARGGAARTAIVGTVLTAAGSPVAGARVTIDGTALGTVANQEGRFMLLGVEPGTHTLAVRSGAAVERVDDVRVAAGATARVEVTVRE